METKKEAIMQYIASKDFSIAAQWLIGNIVDFIACQGDDYEAKYDMARALLNGIELPDRIIEEIARLE